MKKVFFALVSALVIVSFAGLLFAGPPDPAPAKAAEKYETPVSMNKADKKPAKKEAKKAPKKEAAPAPRAEEKKALEKK